MTSPPFPTPDHIAAAQSAADHVLDLTGFYCWPSASLAQAWNESAAGTRPSGQHNYFGIKATATQIASGQASLHETREVIHGKDRIIRDYFANYPSLTDAYIAHAMLFTRVSLYAPALSAPTADEFVRRMAKHYATDPRYTTSILALMRQGNLYQYDRPAAQPLSPKPIPTPSLWARFLSWFRKA